MDKVTLHMLGYLDEKQWLAALDSAPGLHSRQRVKDLAEEVYIHYNLSWSKKAIEKLDLPKD
ncbi:hypothetical protein LCGC14_1247180 [marine sediment metagenome]|uniref:Uncharacterized protein n=1 Tax=marine sediment metagenome TaxID=412755 RepID=A0A0F9P824_9ZZZZ